MSDTTTINSKAMQTLLSQSESLLGQTSTSAAAAGSSFQNLLEKTVNDDARTFSSPSTLATSVLSSRISTGGAAERYERVLAASTPARRPEVSGPGSKSLSAQTSSGSPRAAVAPTLASAGARGSHSTAGPSLKASDLPDADEADGSPNLDATQLKIVNAPALPERPAATPRDAAQLTQARGQSDGSPRTTSAAGQEPGLAGAASQAVSGGQRGFATTLAAAHAAASVPTSLADQAGFDPSLRMNVTAQAAHLSLDTGATGALSAQLQITNGVADVHLTGEAAAALARHGAELSLGLTAAGLQPGRLEITAPSSSADMQSATADGSGSGQFQGEAGSGDDSGSRPEEQTAHDANPAPAPSSTLSGRASRVHVKA